MTTSKWWKLASAVSAVGALLAGGGILAMPARSIELAHVDTVEAERPPENGKFRLGGIEWDTAQYRAAPSLAPMRTFFEEQCHGRSGFAAAQCLSEVFARSFPHGEAAQESFSREYDPVKALEAHMRGEPGQCVTRSALITTILLASGIPARQVQIFTAHQGHTVMEVWDEGGWVYFDPSYGTAFRSERGYLSAAAGFVREEGTATRVGTSPGVPNTFDHGERALRYPEPWLYARTGTRWAMWPFRARYVEAGASLWHTGSGQPLLRRVFVVLGLTALLTNIRRRQLAQREAAPSVRLEPSPVSGDESDEQARLAS